jgi:Glycosyl hydrolase family 20, domain 2/Glycosyl hydrolase family 20, catalytic domain
MKKIFATVGIFTIILTLTARIIPQPVEIKISGPKFTPDKTLHIKCIAANEKSYVYTCAKLLQQEFKTMYGIASDIAMAKTIAPDGGIYLIDKSEMPKAAKAIRAELKLPAAALLRREGYVLSIRKRQTVCIGNDKRGLLYGMWSLSQLFDGKPLSEQQIVDYPAFSLRHEHLPSGRGLTINEYILLCRTLSRFKYNGVSMSVTGCIELKKNPLGYRRYGSLYKPDDIRRLVSIAKKQYQLDIYPEVKSLGKAQWGKKNMWVENDPTLAGMFEPAVEAKKLGCYKNRKILQRTFKVNHPRFYPLLLGVYDELIDIFDHPKYFNVGVEEAFDGPMLASKETGKKPERLLKEHIIRLHDFLKTQGVITMLWTDLILSKPIGKKRARPWHGEKIAATLPKDIIMLDWHYYKVADRPNISPDKGYYATIKHLQNLGYKVVGVPWSEESNIVRMGLSAARYRSLGIMGSYWGLGIRKNMNFRGSAAIVMTAESAWGPLRAKAAIAQYKPMRVIQEYVHRHGGIKCFFYKDFRQEQTGSFSDAQGITLAINVFQSRNFFTVFSLKCSPKPAVVIFGGKQITAVLELKKPPIGNCRMSLVSNGYGVISILLNGHKLPPRISRKKTGDGWVQNIYTVPAAFFKPGKNTLELYNSAKTGCFRVATVNFK